MQAYCFRFYFLLVTVIILQKMVFSCLLTAVDSQFFYFTVFFFFNLCGCRIARCGCGCGCWCGSVCAWAHSAIRHALVDISCTNSRLFLSFWYFLIFPTVWLYFLNFSSNASYLGESSSMLTECCPRTDAGVRVVIVVDKVEAI